MGSSFISSLGVTAARAARTSATHCSRRGSSGGDWPVWSGNSGPPGSSRSMLNVASLKWPTSWISGVRKGRPARDTAP